MKDDSIPLLLLLAALTLATGTIMLVVLGNALARYLFG